MLMFYSVNVRDIGAIHYRVVATMSFRRSRHMSKPTKFQIDSGVLDYARTTKGSHEIFPSCSKLITYPRDGKQQD